MKILSLQLNIILMRHFSNIVGVELFTVIGTDMSRIELRLRSFLESGLVFEDVFGGYFHMANDCYQNILYEFGYLTLKSFPKTLIT
jgi:hypothetical protein